ncbi:hypothetical protein BH09MYX1_BH09MYX1_50130 [soil metagenome]
MTEEDDGKGDAILETLWGRALEAWDDDKVHNALLDFALRRHMLPKLAGRYRAVKDDAKLGTKAQKRLDAIVVAATQMMMAAKTPKRTGNPPWLTGSALLVSAILIGGLIYAVWYYGGRH